MVEFEVAQTEFACPLKVVRHYKPINQPRSAMPPKRLDISWIEIIAKAVFNRPTGTKYIRYEEKDLDELIEEILTLHGAISD